MGFATLKLETSKAYNRVEWPLLFPVLRKVSFLIHLVHLTRKCVTTISYSFQINDRIIDRLQPSRGIRQWDPLSPYMFVLCAQGLSAMLSQFVEHGIFRGILVAIGSPLVSHLFFADDSLIFFRTSSADCAGVK